MGDRVGEEGGEGGMSVALYRRTNDLMGAEVLGHLSPVTCASCQHYDGDHGAWVSTFNPQKYGFCTNALSWRAHKAMPPHEGCTSWQGRDGEDQP